MSTRNGKLANIPNDLREQLNLRLLEGETARELAAWLNALPVVQSTLGAQFNGSPISEVNLTHWRQGGYLQWLTERECFDSARALADGDCDLAKTGFSAERLLSVLTLRIGQLLMRWDSSPDEGVPDAVAFSEVARKARILQGISRSVLAIHRIQSQSARQKSEPATSCKPSGRGEPSNSRARHEEQVPLGPAAAGEMPNTQLEAQTNGALPSTERKSAESRDCGMLGGGKEREGVITNPPSLLGEVPFRQAQGPELAEGLVAERKKASRAQIPRILSGAIAPSVILSNASHTPFKLDPNLAEVLEAV